MKAAVWDTYVQRADGKMMHFDILVNSNLKDEKKIFGFGEEYLSGKPFQTGKITMNECKFCHVEQAKDELIEEIIQKGYSIIEMENCV